MDTTAAGEETGYEEGGFKKLARFTLHKRPGFKRKSSNASAEKKKKNSIPIPNFSPLSWPDDDDDDNDNDNDNESREGITGTTTQKSKEASKKDKQSSASATEVIKIYPLFDNKQLKTPVKNVLLDDDDDEDDFSIPSPVHFKKTVAKALENKKDERNQEISSENISTREDTPTIENEKIEQSSSLLRTSTDDGKEQRKQEPNQKGGTKEKESYECDVSKAEGKTPCKRKEKFSANQRQNTSNKKSKTFGSSTTAEEKTDDSSSNNSSDNSNNCSVNSTGSDAYHEKEQREQKTKKTLALPEMGAHESSSLPATGEYSFSSIRTNGNDCSETNIDLTAIYKNKYLHEKSSTNADRSDPSEPCQNPALPRKKESREFQNDDTYPDEKLDPLDKAGAVTNTATKNDTKKNSAGLAPSYRKHMIENERIEILESPKKRTKRKRGRAVIGVTLDGNAQDETGKTQPPPKKASRARRPKKGLCALCVSCTTCVGGNNGLSKKELGNRQSIDLAKSDKDVERALIRRTAKLEKNAEWSAQVLEQAEKELKKHRRMMLKKREAELLAAYEKTTGNRGDQRFLPDVDVWDQQLMKEHQESNDGSISPSQVQKAKRLLFGFRNLPSTGVQPTLTQMFQQPNKEDNNEEEETVQRDKGGDGLVVEEHLIADACKKLGPTLIGKEEAQKSVEEMEGEDDEEEENEHIYHTCVLEESDVRYQRSTWTDGGLTVLKGTSQEDSEKQECTDEDKGDDDISTQDHHFVYKYEKLSPIEECREEEGGSDDDKDDRQRKKRIRQSHVPEDTMEYGQMSLTDQGGGAYDNSDLVKHVMDDGLDHLLEMWETEETESMAQSDRPGEGIASDAVDDTLLSPRSKEFAVQIHESVVADHELHEAVETNCPNWKENVCYALQQEDEDDILEALEDIRQSMKTTARAKAEILASFRRRECVLQLYERALVQSIKRFES